MTTDHTPAVTPPVHGRDRAEIDDLLARYGFAIDLCRWEDLRSVFTVDATIVYSDRTERHGIDAIVDFFRATATAVAATQHLLHTSRVSATGPDAAEGLTHVTAHHVAHGSPLPAPETSTYTVTGTYTDRFVRTAAGWRIAERRLTLLTRVGDPTILTPIGRRR